MARKLSTLFLEGGVIFCSIKEATLIFRVKFLNVVEISFRIWESFSMALIRSDLIDPTRREVPVNAIFNMLDSINGIEVSSDPR